MPHAFDSSKPTIDYNPDNTNPSTMSKTTVNGDKPHSQTLEHITAYPLSSDIINLYQKNALGQRSINIFQSLYSTFAEPLFPYLKTPYSIIAPYLEKADQLGDNTLSNVDERFPAIKKTDIDTLKSHAATAAQYPFKVAGESKDYVLATYSDEYKKTGGQGILTTGQAILSTELRIASEAGHKFLEWLGPKKDQAQDGFEKMKKSGADKLSKTKKAADEKADQGFDFAQATKDAANDKAQQGKEFAQEKKAQAENY